MRERIRATLGATVIVAALGAPGIAAASTTITLVDERLTVTNDGSDSYIVMGYTSGPVPGLTDSDGVTPGPGCAAVNATFAICGNPGDPNPTTSIVLGAGQDTLFLFGNQLGPTTIDGGPGDDTMTGGVECDTFLAGPGADTMRNFADINQGGSANILCDTVDYSTRTEPVSVSLNGFADDGAPTENDNVTTGMQFVIGGSGDDTVTPGPAIEHSVTLDGHGGSDTLTASLAPSTLIGGDGEDALIGGDGDDQIQGDAGDDVLKGNYGNDRLDPGTGDDIALGGESADTIVQPWHIPPDHSDGSDEIYGGPGLDTADYDRDEPVRVSLDDLANDGLGQGIDDDNVHSDIETVRGGNGNDVLTGSAGADTLDGRGGNDQIDGLDGRDTLLGGLGADVIQALDKAVDTVNCGTDTDAAEVDDIDDVASCENVLTTPVVPPVTPEPLSTNPLPAAVRDLTPATLTLRGLPAAVSHATFARRGLRLTVAVNEPAKLTVSLRGRISRRGRRVAFTGASSYKVLTKRTSRLSAAARSFVLKAPKSLAAALVGRSVRLAVVVRATDTAGNVNTATKRVLLAK